MLVGAGIRFIQPGVASGGLQELDTPLNNFDVAGNYTIEFDLFVLNLVNFVLGIPSGGEFSSGLFGCFENIVPSCILSFFCPCIMFAQVIS